MHAGLWISNHLLVDWVSYVATSRLVKMSTCHRVLWSRGRKTPCALGGFAGESARIRHGDTREANIHHHPVGRGLRAYISIQGRGPGHWWVQKSGSQRVRVKRCAWLGVSALRPVRCKRAQGLEPCGLNKNYFNAAGGSEGPSSNAVHAEGHGAPIGLQFVALQLGVDAKGIDPVCEPLLGLQNHSAGTVFSKNQY